MANEDHGTRGRWIAVPVSYFDVSHELHPHSRGERACESWAWIELIAMARWRDEGGLRRGELRVSQSYLATRWRWARSRVQRFLEDLEKAGELRRGHGTGREPDIIRICNYDRYQKPRTASGSANGSANGSQKKKEYNYFYKKEGAAFAAEWEELARLIEGRALCSIGPADIEALSPAAQYALRELGGVAELKGMDGFQFNRAAKRFPVLCREAASRGGGRREDAERDRGRESAASADGRGRGPSRPDVTLPALQVVQ